MGATLTALNHQATGTRHMFTGFCAVVMMLLSEMEHGECHLGQRNRRVTLGRLSWYRSKTNRVVSWPFGAIAERGLSSTRFGPASTAKKDADCRALPSLPNCPGFGRGVFLSRV